MADGQLSYKISQDITQIRAMGDMSQERFISLADQQIHV